MPPFSSPGAGVEEVDVEHLGRDGLVDPHP